MAGREPEETVARPACRQGWHSLTFLHWAYDPASIQTHLPEGFEVDTRDGVAWVSMTPFLMTDLRTAGLPPPGRWSTFPETNLRTYVRGPDGRDGIWFFSLEAASLPLVVSASSLYGVPYKWAAMRVEGDDDAGTVRYRSRRRIGRTAIHDITVRIGDPCDVVPDLEHWLSGRWRAWTRVLGRPCTVPVQHPPWPLCDATVVRLEQSLTAAARLPDPAGPPLVRFCRGIDVALGWPRRA